jgi:outer membrane receptor for ferrienterochelin and colicin
MNTRRILLFLPILSCLLGQAGPVFAQSGGKIAGRVKDARTGEGLPGVNLLIEGSVLGAAADENGYYTILRVPPGRYTLRAQAMGYRRTAVRGVEVLTDLTTTIHFSLEPEALQGEEVVIVAEKPLVRKDLTSSESRIQADEIDRMPVQGINDILDLQAGITRGTDGALHIRGGRSSEVATLVNGVSITDDYSRGQAFTVENESVQELQVVSGTFNAEYGNAMSGVINVVTKTGGSAFTGKLEAWSGDYASGRKNLFWHIDDIDPLAEHHVQATASGPVVKDRISFFVTGRRTRNEGWLYGPYAFSPQGRSATVAGRLVSVTGDSHAVAMNPQSRWSGHASLKWKILNPLTLKVDFLGSATEMSGYTQAFRLNPDGRRGYQGGGAAVIANLTHVLGRNAYTETTFSYKSNRDRSRLYDDPADPRYMHPDSLTAGAYHFFRAGTDLYRSDRSTKSWIGKLDLTSQVTRRHQFKTGLEFQKDRIDLETMTLIPATDANGLQITPFRPAIPSLSSANHNLLRREPDRFAVYAQDKIEYESVVINIGLRFDRFRSNGLVPVDPQDPNVYNPLKPDHVFRDLDGDGVIAIGEQTEANRYSLGERRAFWTTPAKAKVQLSPRFGIAYPITDRGVIHFSYGIFQQIPDYSQLFDGDEVKLTEGQGIAGPFGNPDLNPQRTTMYELGLKQQVSDRISIDVTGYYRDIRDWISTSAPIPTYSAGVTYSKKINRDYANVTGVTFALDKQLSDFFAFNADYTFQIVQGTNSSPEDEYLALNAGAEPRKTLSPLDWDQRHSLNLSVFAGTARWGVHLIGLFQTGQPYTPEIVSGTLTGQNVLSGLATNSRIKPSRFTVDVNAFRAFTVRGMGLELFVRVFNLFDTKNPLTLWADSGRPDYTVYQKQAVEADPTWFLRPDFYSEPRRILAGVKIGFSSGGPEP